MSSLRAPRAASSTSLVGPMGDSLQCSYFSSLFWVSAATRAIASLLAALRIIARNRLFERGVEVGDICTQRRSILGAANSLSPDLALGSRAGFADFRARMATVDRNTANTQGIAEDRRLVRNIGVWVAGGALPTTGAVRSRLVQRNSAGSDVPDTRQLRLPCPCHTGSLDHQASANVRSQPAYTCPQ